MNSAGRDCKMAMVKSDEGDAGTKAQALVDLGLAGPATPQDVRNAFRQKLKTAHPDVNGGNDTLLRRILSARDMLMSDARPDDHTPEQLPNLAQAYGEPIELRISLEQAIHGGHAFRDVPALEVSAVHEKLTSLTQMKTVGIDLPKGLRTGDTLALKTDGAARAEQLFHIAIETDPHCRAWGDDIWMTVRIEARLFAAGGTADIVTPHGLRLIDVAADTPRGASLCLAGLGLPATGMAPAGNLYLRLEAMMNTVRPWREAVNDFRQKWVA